MYQENLKEEFFEINGKKEGILKLYYKNGNIMSIRNYVNNKLNGEYERYYENGNIYEICNYVNGKLNGEYKLFYENKTN